MAVTLLLTASQSSDGATLTFTDGSTYTDTDLIASFTRTLVLKDSADETLATSVYDLGDMTIDYSTDKDIWVDATLTSVGSTTHTEEFSFYFFRNTANKLIAANAEGCCTSKSAKENLSEALRFIKGAEYAAPIGNATGFQTNIDAANTYLDLVV